MAIDNFDNIIPLMKFRTKDDFYYIQILQRKKEVDTISSNSNVVKNCYIIGIDEHCYLTGTILNMYDNKQFTFEFNDTISW